MKSKLSIIVLLAVSTLLTGCFSHSKARVIYQEHGGYGIQDRNIDESTMPLSKAKGYTLSKALHFINATDDEGNNPDRHHSIFGKFDANYASSIKEANTKWFKLLNEQVLAVLLEMNLSVDFARETVFDRGRDENETFAAFTYGLISPEYSLTPDNSSIQIYGGRPLMIDNHWQFFPQGREFSFVRINLPEDSTLNTGIFYSKLSKKLPNNMYLYLSNTSRWHVKTGKSNEIKSYPYILSSGKEITFTKPKD